MKSRRLSEVIAEAVPLVSELFRKLSDDRECGELSKLQIKQAFIICDVLRINDAELAEEVDTFIKIYTEKRTQAR